jgi:diguanylate cyclase (GGDEF)-like protein/PAS domain S-box-containing protein
VDLKALFDDAVTGMIVVGVDGRFQAVNRAFCDLLGYEEAELLGRHPMEITHPDHQEQSYAVVEQLTRGERTADQTQKRYLRKDGTVVHVVRTVTILRDHSGRPSGLFTQVVDVTALTLMEQSVRRSEKWFKALIAHSSDVTVVLDRDGLVTYASPAFETAFGWRPRQVLGRRVFDFLDPAEVEPARQALAAHLLEPGPRPAALYAVVHRSGERREVEVITTNLLDDPDVGAIVCNVRDVTEQNRHLRRTKSAERRFRSMVGNSWDIISLHDLAGNYLYCSPAVEQLGYTPEELIGHSPSALLHLDDAHVGLTFASVLERASQSTTLQYRARHRDGSWRWLESVFENRIDDPDIQAVVVTTRDVTYSRRRGRQQEATAALGSLAVTHGSLGLLLERIPAVVADVLEALQCTVVWMDSARRPELDRSGGPGPASRPCSGTAACAVSLRAAALQRPVAWTCPGPGAACQQLTLEDIATANAVAVPVMAADGPRAVISAFAATVGVFGADDVSFLESVANILAAAATRQDVEDQLRHRATHDELTHLPNRTLLLDRLEAVMARREEGRGCVAVAFVDVDDFKVVNDSLGHSYGDEVIRAVSRRLGEAVGPDHMIGRFGGDEFVVVAEVDDAAEALKLAEHLQHLVSLPLALDDGTISLSASVGFVVTSDPAVSAETVLADADIAMYEAKRAGKARIQEFDPVLRQRVNDQLNTVSGIRRALHTGEFRLFYQPVVRMATGEPVAHEGLVRWQHPTLGLLTPDHFIEHAETSGLIVPLGEWVLRAGLAQSARWRAEGRPSRVSINVSGVQLRNADLVAVVTDALADSGAEAGDLTLEVTESAVLGDVVGSRQIIGDLRRLGVHVAMDDFGTGWSSLSHLARLPFDIVKIDRSFLRHLDDDSRTAAMLESIVGLCAALDLIVVVEGVETRRHLEHLRGLGVEFGQGYLFGRPQPVEGVRAP